MRNKGIIFWAICVVLLPAEAGAVTIGNVTGFLPSGQDVDFTISDGSALRITILDADTVRVRFAPGGSFTPNVSRAVAYTGWPGEPFTAGDFGTFIRIQTGELRIDVQKTPCVVGFYDTLGNLINTDDPARRIEWTSTYTRVYKTTQPGEDYLGLGWRPVSTLRKNGTRFAMRNYPTYSLPEYFYGGIPFWYGLRNGKAYGIFFDDTSWGEIDAGATDPSYLSFENNGGEVDYYFFSGPEMSTILDRYTLLTGRPFMPPKWACGYQQCRWSYTPQSQVLNIANEFRTRSIPCDVIYLDIDYMPGGVALEFNGSTFPDPAGMISTLHSQGFHVVANISPFIFVHDSKYGTANSLGYFIQEPGGGTKTGWHDYWYFVGGAASGSMSWIDFSMTAARNWWKSQHTPFLNYGIDGVWNDLNEPDELGGAWAVNTPYNFDGSPVDHEDTSTQYCLLQTDSSYETLNDHYTNTRPFVLSRGAYAGIQRSSAVWSGDNTSNWDHIARNIPMGLSMSISGQPHNGHDIGGFFGYPDFNDKPPDELFARWMQWGVFSGFVRAHHDGFGNNDPLRPFVEPWEFGTTVENICRDVIGLRYQLMPYVYSLYHEAHTTGAPLQRPLVYDFPADPLTVNRDYDFMFGPNMLVAPVVSLGAVTKSAYLPSGAGWTDYWTDTHYAGGQTVNVSAPLDRIPIFMPDGAIIPMGSVMQYADEFTLAEITLAVWPSTSAASFTLYEDDGVTFDYQSGEYAETVLAQDFDGTTFHFDVSARSGNFNPGSRHWLVKVHRWSDPVTSITLDGGGLTEYFSLGALQSAGTGYYVDLLAGIVYARFADTGSARSLMINEVPSVSSWHTY